MTDNTHGLGTAGPPLYTHGERGGLFEARAGDDGMVSMWPQGGGFELRLSADQFAQQFRLAQQPAMAKGWVTGDFLDSVEMLPCYSDGRAWNGFGMPYFDAETAQRLVAMLPELSYRKSDGIIQSAECGGSEIVEYKRTTITVNGQEIVVYPIGTASWVWDSVVFCGQPDDGDESARDNTSVR